MNPNLEKNFELSIDVFPSYVLKTRLFKYKILLLMTNNSLW